jgi:hypothetical protein
LSALQTALLEGPRGTERRRFAGEERVESIVFPDFANAAGDFFVERRNSAAGDMRL